MATVLSSASTMVSEDVLDEVWLMMHMAAEMGASHVAPGSASGEHKFIFEADVEDDFIEQTVEAGDPSHADEKEKALIDVAETLMQLGDNLNKNREKENDLNELSKEIAKHINEVMAPNIERQLERKLSRQSAMDVFSKSGVLNVVYGMFKEKVGNFIGAGHDLGHIALVSHITRGVAQGLHQSTSRVAGLLATVSTMFVQEKYGDVLKECTDKGGLASVVQKRQ